MGAGAIVPAGGGRTIFVLPWLGQTLIGTTDTDHEGAADHVQPVAGGGRLPARRGQRVLRRGVDAGRPRRRLRGRAAADLDRRPAQVGRHLAQGRALRDLERDGHDHRRQAHHLAADGEGDRRPDRRSATARSVTCRTHEVPLGMPVAAPTSWPRPEGVARAAGRPLRPRRPRRAGARGERPELAEPIVAGRPTCWPRSPTRRRREQARTVGDVLLRRTRLGLTAARTLLAPGRGRSSASRPCSARSWAGIRRAARARRRRSARRPVEEGILPAA